MHSLAAWNFRSGDRAREASFVMMHQRELRKVLEMGEAEWKRKVKQRKKRRGKNKTVDVQEWDEQATDLHGLAVPDLNIEFDADEEDEEDAYSWGSAAGFSLAPGGLTERPESQRDGFLDAARDLVERAALQDSGLTTSLETITLDDDAPEDSKDLMTFGTVAVDAPASPGWVPPSTDEPSRHSARAPVFLIPKVEVEPEVAVEPEFEAKEVVTEAPAPQRAQNAPEQPAPITEPQAVVATETQPVQQAPSKLPIVAGVAGIAVLVAVVSVVVTLGTLSISAPDGPTAPTVAPVPTATVPAPVAPEQLDPVAEVETPEVDPLDPTLADPDLQVEPEIVEPNPEDVEPEVVEPEVVEPEVVEPDVVEPEPEVVEPEPEVVEPEPDVVEPEPDVVEPEPEVVEPEPEPAAAAGPNLVGSWGGTAGVGAMRLSIGSQNGNTVSGTLVITVAGVEESHSVSGQLDPSSGAVTLSDIGGSGSYSGTLRGTNISGTWRASPGAAARQWFVVKQ